MDTQFHLPDSAVVGRREERIVEDGSMWGNAERVGSVLKQLKTKVTSPGSECGNRDETITPQLSSFSLFPFF